MDNCTPILGGLQYSPQACILILHTYCSHFSLVFIFNLRSKNGNRLMRLPYCLCGCPPQQLLNSLVDFDEI
jgi:hypothetical protein